MAKAKAAKPAKKAAPKKKPAKKAPAPAKKAVQQDVAEDEDSAPLDDQHRLFVAEYQIDFNGTRAAIAAGYSPKTATSQASRLLRNVNVQAALQEAVGKRLNTIGADADALLSRLVAEVNADLADLYDEDGSLKPVAEWPRVWRTGLVAGIDTEALFAGRGEDREQIGTIQKVKLADRGKRLEMLGRHIKVGAFKEIVQHDVTDPLKQLAQSLLGTSLRPRE